MESLPWSEIEDIKPENRSCGYKLVPWLSWDEWNFVRESLFSSSPNSVASALRRISAWRSRGCLPVVIEVTASIIEIQQRDSFFRADLTNDDSQSEEMLAMLYCMAIIRLVNCVVEKTRKRKEVSVAEAADEIGMPRMLIDIRHEGSHRDLPSLHLVRRCASIEALNWLKSYYWEPQKMAIPCKSDETARIKKEIKSKLQELAFCLKVKQSVKSNSSAGKEKRVKHFDPLCGRNKLLSLMAGNLRYSSSRGSRFRITKTLKNVVGLYSSFSSVVVSALLEYMLKSSDSLQLSSDPQVEPNGDNSQTAFIFDDWKRVITKLSNKKQELLPTILKAILVKMEKTQESMDIEFGNRHQIEHLSSLFARLVKILRGLKLDEDTHVARATLIELIHKCLLVSGPGNENNKLKGSALVLAQITRNSSLIEKIKKLFLICSSNEENCCENFDDIQREDEFIRQAGEKLELLMARQMKTSTDGHNIINEKRWVVAKSWNPCPIGMLPCEFDSSGILPVLDCDDENKEVLEIKGDFEMKRCSGKREASCEVEELDDSCVKKMRETVEESESDGDGEVLFEGVDGRLMIGGDWRKVGEDDIIGIKSAIRILL